MQKILCKKFNILGRVQGVFFRASAQKQAKALGLTGFARNEKDSSVTVVACGDEVALQALEAWLWKGPIAAKVSQVNILPCETQSYNDFTTL
jgi:acylphosphatase